ncbi:hypothetical protein [Lachnobacterium bovis]|uniref:Flagellar operon protein TIGR03826 n=1 Tax=Lachnobacterium bovis TaxID=140626 RepID=A0A1H9P3A3_9FIRM|nr:hypothetical protein [Lachnobacterium bovis]SER42680.1 hypothetical protein SAMN02910429_00073 [Lachnobacterium bovis]
MQKQQFLFDTDGKTCKICGRPINNDDDEIYCPLCKEHELFQQVKNFIRENDVNEFEVSSEFDIPLGKVKKWIREGRIEYRDTPTVGKSARMRNLNCELCGKAISFGTLCPQCLKKQNSKGVGIGLPTPQGNSASMHFLDTEDKNK